MFLPISDAPNPKGTPVVTYLLSAANVLAFLPLNRPLGAERPDPRDPAFREYVEVMSHQVDSRAELQRIVNETSEYSLVSFEHGYRPASPRLASLLTCMFLHGGFMHLFGNMLFLWIYGDNVEKRLGGFAYLFWYLATGVAATLSHALVFSDSEMPLVGASGAISGILGFYFVFFPRNSVRMLAFLPPFLMQVFEIPARFVLGMFLLVDNLLPFLFAGGGGVAHGAHIGGFAVGAALGWIMGKRGLGSQPDLAGDPGPSGPEPRAIHDALAEGRHVEAARRYFALPAASAHGILSPG